MTYQWAESNRQVQVDGEYRRFRRKAWADSRYIVSDGDSGWLDENGITASLDAQDIGEGAGDWNYADTD